MGKPIVDLRNPNLIRKLGIAALTKELGPVGMVYFLRQFDRGAGDYTAERGEWLPDESFDDIAKQLKEINKKATRKKAPRKPAKPATK